MEQEEFAMKLLDKGEDRIIELLKSNKLSINEKEWILKNIPILRESLEAGKNFEEIILKDFEDLKKLVSKVNNKTK